MTDCLCEDELKASRRNKGLKEAVQDHFQTQPEHLIFSISISSCERIWGGGNEICTTVEMFRNKCCPLTNCALISHSIVLLDEEELFHLSYSLKPIALTCYQCKIGNYKRQQRFYFKCNYIRSRMNCFTQKFRKGWKGWKFIVQK